MTSLLVCVAVLVICRVLTVGGIVTWPRKEKVMPISLSAFTVVFLLFSNPEKVSAGFAYAQMFPYLVFTFDLDSDQAVVLNASGEFIQEHGTGTAGVAEVVSNVEVGIPGDFGPKSFLIFTSIGPAVALAPPPFLPETSFFLHNQDPLVQFYNFDPNPQNITISWNSLWTIITEPPSPPNIADSGSVDATVVVSIGPDILAEIPLFSRTLANGESDFDTPSGQFTVTLPSFLPSGATVLLNIEETVSATAIAAIAGIPEPSALIQVAASAFDPVLLRLLPQACYRSWSQEPLVLLKSFRRYRLDFA